jgi:hypothetical protein
METALHQAFSDLLFLDLFSRSQQRISVDLTSASAHLALLSLKIQVLGRPFDTIRIWRRVDPYIGLELLRGGARVDPADDVVASFVFVFAI